MEMKLLRECLFSSNETSNFLFSLFNAFFECLMWGATKD